jgi:CheY-like chemotaxis protein
VGTEERTGPAAQASVQEELSMNLQPDELMDPRPCIILAHRDRAYAARLYRTFRTHGCQVYLAGSGPEVRRLARTVPVTVVVLDTELDEESGWLTCEKLTGEQPHLKVILVDESSEPDGPPFATFVGAVALVRPRDGVQALVDEVLGAALPAIG